MTKVERWIRNIAIVILKFIAIVILKLLVTLALCSVSFSLLLLFVILPIKAIDARQKNKSVSIEKIEVGDLVYIPSLKITGEVNRVSKFTDGMWLDIITTNGKVDIIHSVDAKIIKKIQNAETQ